MKREQAIDLFIEAKKKRMRANQAFTFLVVSIVVKKLNQAYDEKFIERAKARYGRILAVCLLKHWQKTALRNGKSLDEIQRNKIRRNFTIMAIVSHDLVK